MLARRSITVLAAAAGIFAGSVGFPAEAPKAAPTAAAVSKTEKKDKPAAKTAETAQVSGTVMGSEGKPVAGAIVRVLAVREEARGPFGRRIDARRSAEVVNTGDDGAFTATGLDGTKFRVRIEAPDHAPLNAEDVPAGASLRLTLKRGLPLSGRVFDMDARKALPGATVIAYDRGAQGFGPEAGIRVAAGDDGRFTFRDLPAGVVDLEAWSPSHATARARDIVVRPPPSEESGERPVSPELFLRPGGRLAGRVVGSDGKPVEEANVGVRPTGANIRRLMNTDLPRGLTTDASGRFEIPGLPVGRYKLAASKTGLSDAETETIEIARGTDRGDIEIKLEKAASLAFRLVDEKGDPLVGLSVALLPAREARRGRAAMRMGVMNVPEDQIEQGEDGKVVAKGLDVGTFIVSIRPDDAADIEKEDVRLRAGETTDLGTLRAVPGTFISGRIEDKTGAPVAGATVAAFWTDGMQPRSRSVKSKDDGRYKLAGLGEQPIQSMWVEAKGFSRAERERVAPGEKDVDFTLERTASVTGRVILADGTVPAAFEVKAHGEAEAAESPFSMRRFMTREPENDFSDPEGKFRLDDVPPGTVTIEAKAIGKRPTKKTGVTTAAEQVVDVGTLVLEDGRTLRGRVLAAADGVALAGASAIVNVAQGGMAFRIPGMDAGAGSAVTGSDGGFEIHGLEGRTYTMSVQHPDYAPSESSVEVPADQDPPETVVRLSRGGTLTGTVRDASKNPVTGAAIVAMRGLFGGDMNTAETGPDGRYTMEKLAPGSYNVMRPPEDGGGMANFGMKQATITEGETTVVDFDETARHTLTGRVVRGKATVGSVTLLFFPGESAGFGAGGFKTTQADEAGNYQIGLDQPGAYTVMVQSGGGFGRSTSVAISVPDAPTSAIDIVLKIGGVTGRVSDSDGQPVAGAMVAARLDGSTDPLSGQSGAMTEPDGSFSIEGLQPGTYRVTASATGFAPAEAYPVSVSEDEAAPDLDLRLERGRVLRGKVVDPRGSGVQGAMVFAGPPGTVDPTVGPAMTDVNGSFVMTVGDEPSWDVTAIGTGFAPALARGVPPTTEGDPPLTLAVGVGGRARIQVVTGEGAPVAGAIVVLRANPPYLGSGAVGFLNRPAATGSDGATTASALAPGSYDVTVQIGTKTGSGQVVVPEGGEAAARITIP